MESSWNGIGMEMEWNILNYICDEKWKRNGVEMERKLNGKFMKKVFDIRWNGNRVEMERIWDMEWKERESNHISKWIQKWNGNGKGIKWNSTTIHMEFPNGKIMTFWTIPCDSIPLNSITSHEIPLST